MVLEYIETGLFTKLDQKVNELHTDGLSFVREGCVKDELEIVDIDHVLGVGVLEELGSTEFAQNLHNEMSDYVEEDENSSTRHEGDVCTSPLQPDSLAHRSLYLILIPHALQIIMDIARQSLGLMIILD